MKFELPEILQIERAGRAMSLGIKSSVEAGVSPCPAGAASMVALRMLKNRGINVRLSITEESDASSIFNTQLKICRKMGIPTTIDETDEDDFPCVISGMDVSATIGSGNFYVAARYLQDNHPGIWDNWNMKDSAYLNEPQDDRTISIKQARAIDEIATNEFGLPSICLMENAGIGAAVVANDMFSKIEDSGEVVIIAGPGKNGGDAFVVARGLLERGLPVRVIPLAESYQGDALTNYEILCQHDQFIDRPDEKSFEKIISSARLIVDGIFGTGLNKEITGEFAQKIQVINDSPAKVLSLDVPSGLNADTGEIMGACINANKTATFAGVKVGMTSETGKEVCGEIIVADIGNPK